MRSIIFFVLFCGTTVASFAQVVPASKVNAADGNATGVKQNPLNLGNWVSPVSTPQYKFFTDDLGGTSPLQIHSTRWAGGLLVTRDGSAGETSLMELYGYNGVGTVMNLFNGANQVKISFNSAGNSYFNAGSLAVGTIDAQGYKLAVNGDAIFTKIKVKVFGNWPDYVFHKNYQLPSLADLEKFIKEHSHLPGIPAAAEVEKEGVDLGENQAALLKKIEELTLHIIQQNKRINELEKAVQKMNVTGK